MRVSYRALLAALLVLFVLGTSAPTTARRGGMRHFLPLLATMPGPPPMTLDWQQDGIQPDGRVRVSAFLRGTMSPVERTVRIAWTIDGPADATASLCTISHTLPRAAPTRSLVSLQAFTATLTLPPDSAHCSFTLPPDHPSTLRQRAWWVDPDPPVFLTEAVFQISP